MKWTDEHESIRETAAKFVDNEINPYVDPVSYTHLRAHET